MFVRICLKGLYYDEPTLIEVLDSETRERVIAMTKPWSFVSKDIDFRFDNFKIDETNNKHLLVLAGRYYDLEYSISEKLWGKSIQWFLDNKNQLAFFRSYDLDTEESTDWVGDKNDVFSLYCPKFIMEIVKKAWDILEPMEIHRMEENLVGLINQQEIFKILWDNKKDSSNEEFVHLIANWVEKWNDLCNAFKPYSFDKVKEDFSYLEKYYYYIRTLTIENRKRPEVLKRFFPNGISYKEFTNDNFKKIVDLVYERNSVRTWSVTDITNNVGTDAETTIMSALSHGEGDAVGY